MLATLNSAGYRYGAADQAFYIPAILRHVDPALFPRDAALIDSQSRLFILDEVFAWLMSATGIGLPAWFLLGYLVTLATHLATLTWLGRSIFANSWTIAAFVTLSTLRHRITKTGANSLEGFFHPRQLAFAIGLVAIAAVLRRRVMVSIVAVVVAGAIHPTTALWFSAWVGVALIVNERGLRPKLLALAAVAVAGAAIVLSTGFLSMAPMDAAWLSTLADKDYVFPNDWAPATWAVNLLYPVVIGASFLVRQRLGLALPAERGVVVGCLSLVAAFLAALPFIAAGIAAFVQLQVSRVFWMADALSAAYVAWWLCEARWGRGLDRGGVPRLPGAAGSWRPILVTALLVAAASARGWYVLAVEHPGRPLVQVTFPDDAWQDVSTWLQRHTPKNAHLLADPGHAFLYGFSLRVTAARDVFLENVKDGSIAMYDRQVAMRVAERRAALGDFADLTGPRAQDLAARYDLQCLVSERPFPLPELYRNRQFRVYRLQP